jgi:hypothetical protein
MDDVVMANRMIKLETAMKAQSARITLLENELGKYATQGHLKTSEANTKNIINQNSILINDLEQKLLTVSIPDDTKYYLSNTEIEDFRNTYRKLIAMMTDSERLYQSLIAYTATLDQR